MEHWENGGLKATGPLHLLFPLPRDQKWFIGSDKSVECNCFDFSFLIYQHQGHWLPDIVEGIGPGENVRDSMYRWQSLPWWFGYKTLSFLSNWETVQSIQHSWWNFWPMSKSYFPGMDQIEALLWKLTPFNQGGVGGWSIGRWDKSPNLKQTRLRPFKILNQGNMALPWLIIESQNL